MAIYESTSPDGAFRLMLATPGGVSTVLADLSHVEEEELDRLGITKEAVEAEALKEVEGHRAFMVVDHIRPWEVLALCGIDAAGSIWLLPRQFYVDYKRRGLASKSVISWIVEFLVESAWRRGLSKPRLWNGVTAANSTVIRWLRKIVGATFEGETVMNGHRFLLFTVPRR